MVPSSQAAEAGGSEVQSLDELVHLRPCLKKEKEKKKKRLGVTALQTEESEAGVSLGV